MNHFREIALGISVSPALDHTAKRGYDDECASLEEIRALVAMQQLAAFVDKKK